MWAETGKNKTKQKVRENHKQLQSDTSVYI